MEEERRRVGSMYLSMGCGDGVKAAILWLDVRESIG